jgi:hypothetical protein
LQRRAAVRGAEESWPVRFLRRFLIAKKIFSG